MTSHPKLACIGWLHDMRFLNNVSITIKSASLSACGEQNTMQKCSLIP